MKKLALFSLLSLAAFPAFAHDGGAGVSITAQSVIMLVGLVFLLLATLGTPSSPRWSWFPAGMLFWGIALFVSITWH